MEYSNKHVDVETRQHASAQISPDQSEREQEFKRRCGRDSIHLYHPISQIKTSVRQLLYIVEYKNLNTGPIQNICNAKNM